jgi:hypothetical protein
MIRFPRISRLTVVFGQDALNLSGRAVQEILEKKTPPKIKETSNPTPHTVQLNYSEVWTVISRESVVAAES